MDDPKNLWRHDSMGQPPVQPDDNVVRADVEHGAGEPDGTYIPNADRYKDFSHPEVTSTRIHGVGGTAITATNRTDTVAVN